MLAFRELNPFVILEFIELNSFAILEFREFDSFVILEFGIVSLDGIFNVVLPVWLELEYVDMGLKVGDRVSIEITKKQDSGI